MKDERPPSGAFDRAVLRFSRAAMFLPAVCVAAMCYEVVSRYVFNSPTLWAFDLSWWLAGTTYILAGIYVMQQRAHIRITLFYDRMPRRMRAACDWLSCALTFCFCAAVVWGGYNEARAKLLNWEGVGSAWNPPIPAVMKPLILAVVCVIAVQSFLNLINDARAERRTGGGR